MRLSELKDLVLNGGLDEKLTGLYGEEKTAEQRIRYAHILEKAIENIGDKEGCIFSAPGRTEIGGNHTDHQLGRVVAASLNLDIVAAVVPTDDMTVRYYSDEFTVKPVDLGDLSIREADYNTTESLIRGIAAGIKGRGKEIGGFSAYAESDVIPGGGMSSSAAFEVLIGTIYNSLYASGSLSSEELAIIGQFAENKYFGKPSGLLDQMACSVGSFAAMDFADPAAPVVEKIDFNPADYGFDLILTDVKASHADLGDEYAAVPKEMRAAAAVLGHEVLRDVSEVDLIANADRIRSECGDRAFLRAFHFVNETRRAKEQAEALKNRDIDTFLRLVRESGHSSFMYLQNISVPGHTKDQPVALALALSDALIKENGAYRVHGGGFAGTIQAFVKKENTPAYVAALERAFGKGSCYIMRIRDCGGIKVI
ncbi:MAG: galactokinase [Solobacterium sp.]|nr:galactokinase [Solobacterium sp.]